MKNKNKEVILWRRLNFKAGCNLKKNVDDHHSLIPSYALTLCSFSLHAAAKIIMICVEMKTESL